MVLRAVALAIAVLGAMTLFPTFSSAHQPDPDSRWAPRLDAQRREARGLTDQLRALHDLPADRRSAAAGDIGNVAVARRDALAALARRDPRAAAALALTPAQRAAVPRPARAAVEERATLEGYLSIMHGDYDDGHAEYVVTLNAPSGAVPLALAVDLGAAKSGDWIRAGGLLLPGNGALIADQVTVIRPAAAVTALGTQRTAIILASAPGQNAHPYAGRSATASMFFSRTSGVSTYQFIYDGSYGQTIVAGGAATAAAALEGNANDVYGPYTIGSATPGTSCDFAVVQPILDAADASGTVDFRRYDRVAIAWNNNGCGSGGQANVGAIAYPLHGASYLLSVSLDKNSGFGSTLANGRAGGTALHEYGHNLGLFHASTLDCGAAPIGGTACYSSEYADLTDRMGNGPYDGEYNAFHKDRLGWLGNGRARIATTSGTYALGTLEDATAGAVNTLKIPRTRDAANNPVAYYYLEYRRPSAVWGALERALPEFATGVIVHTAATGADCSNYCLGDFVGGGGDSVLIDTHPGSFPDRRDFEDAPIQPGETYTDRAAGVSIRVASTSTNGASVEIAFSTPMRVVQATVNPPGAGTVDGAGTYSSGQNVTLTAMAAPGYTFRNWRDYRRQQPYANPYSFNATGDRFLEAVFFANTPPANDNFADAVALTSLPTRIVGDTTGATTEAGESNLCAGISNTVWYSYKPGATTIVTASTGGSAFDTVLGVFTGGDVGSLTSVACNDQVDKTDQSRLTFVAVTGTTYRIQIGSYKPGSAATVTTGKVILNLTTEPPPSNDNFANATTITTLPLHVAISLTGATIERGEPASSCPTTNSIWFKYTPTVSTVLGVATGDSSVRTVQALWAGNTLDTLTSLGCKSHANNGMANSNWQWRLAKGMIYWIQLGLSPTATQGTFGEVSVDFAAQAPPANDSFAAAIAIGTLPAKTSVDVAAATTQTGEPTGTACGTFQHSVWYSYTPSADASVTIVGGGTYFPGAIAVYTGLAVNALTKVTCAFGTTNTPAARLTFDATHGTTYWIQADGWNGRYGRLYLNLFGTSAGATSNDSFANPTPLLAPTQLLTSTVGATTQSDEPASTPCGPTGNTLWYSYTAPSDGFLALDTAGTDFTPNVAVYAGAGLTGLTVIGCSSFAGADNQARLTAPVLGGTTYRIQVGGYNGASGNMALTVTSPTPPDNRTFASAAALTSASVQATASTLAVSNEPGEPLTTTCGPIGGAVWYRYVASAPTLTLDTLGSDFDTLIAIYTGSSPAALTPVACNDDAGQGRRQARVSAAVLVGTTYYVQVGGYAGARGSLVLNLTASGATQAYLPITLRNKAGGW